MTSAEPLESTSSASVPPPASPRERQAARLALAIEAKKAQISEVLRRHADTINDSLLKSSIACSARHEVEVRAAEVAEDWRLTRMEIEDLLNSLRLREKRLAELELLRVALEGDLIKAKSAESDAAAESDLKCSEPNRHVGALRKDLEKLERRLALNVAHQTSHFKALFPGARNQP